jgi:hypothetical protein
MKRLRVAMTTPCRSVVAAGASEAGGRGHPLHRHVGKPAIRVRRRCLVQSGDTRRFHGPTKTALGRVPLFPQGDAALANRRLRWIQVQRRPRGSPASPHVPDLSLLCRRGHSVSVLRAAHAARRGRRPRRVDARASAGRRCEREGTTVSTRLRRSLRHTRTPPCALHGVVGSSCAGPTLRPSSRCRAASRTRLRADLTRRVGHSCALPRVANRLRHRRSRRHPTSA